VIELFCMADSQQMGVFICHACTDHKVSATGVTLQAKPKEMVRAEPTNNRTASIDTNHSTMFMLLLKLNIMCEQRWIQFELQNRPSRVFAFGGQLYTTI